VEGRLGRNFGRLAAAAMLTVGYAAGVSLAFAVLDWPGRGAALAGVVAPVLVIGVLARLGVNMAGLATADFVLRSPVPADRAEVYRRMAAAGMTVTGVALGLAAVAVGAGFWLSTEGSGTDRLVTVLAGLGLLMRSAVFRGQWTRLVLAAAGSAVLALGGYHLATGSHADATWLAPLTLTVLAGVLLAVIQSRQPRLGDSHRRLRHWFEATVVIAMLCACVAALGPHTVLIALVG
jgi:hypothetical protein